MSYLEERTLRFIDVTDNPDPTIKPVDNNQPITDFEDEKVKIKNKYATKKKAQLDNLHASVRAHIASSTALLLPRFALVSCPRFFTPLSSYLGSFIHLLLFFTYPGTPTALLSHLVPTSVLESLAILLSLSLLGPTPSYFAYISLKTFKQALFNKFL